MYAITSEKKVAGRGDRRNRVVPRQREELMQPLLKNFVTAVFSSHSIRRTMPVEKGKRPFCMPF